MEGSWRRGGEGAEGGQSKLEQQKKDDSKAVRLFCHIRTALVSSCVDLLRIVIVGQK